MNLISATAIDGKGAVSSIQMQMYGKPHSNREISLYFHIPFCTTKCHYCHFYVIPDKDPFKVKLLEGFHLEWQYWLESLKNHQVVSIYFGGGTPSLLGSERLASLLNIIEKDLSLSKNSIEITLEANPENVSLELMRAYADVGVNRISLGVQTLDDRLLNLLSRHHDAKKALDAIYLTQLAGIENISIDLMYDLPGQTLASWEHTLSHIPSLPITHLSLYNLTIEPHTVFFKYREKLKKIIPDEHSSLKMYEKAVEILDEAHLKRYEISAFAKEGKISCHNTGYWTGRPFLGFGPSAFSYWKNKRFRNIANLNRYHTSLISGKLPIDFEEELPLNARRRELFVIMLRLCQGVDLKLFYQQYGPLDEETLQTLNDLIHQNLIIQNGTLITLSFKGILFYDTVAAELV